MEGESSSHSSRRSTRAQAAPDWSSAETLTLITEISAFDNDCGGSVASFQKWKTVSKAISAAGIRRSLDQCRRKWAELMEVYNKVKELGSFWALDEEVRAEIRVSEDFDLEVFRAMDEYLKGGDEDGERESGGEEGGYEGAADHDEADDFIEDYEEESGFEKQKNHLIARKRKCNAPETVSKLQKLSEKARKRGRPRLTPTVLTEEVDVEVNLLNEQKILLATNHHHEEEEEEEEQDEGQVLATKLLEYAKSIEAIVIRTPSVSDDPLSADSNDSETDFVREQGDQLITYLGKLAQTVRQLSDSPLMFSGSV